MNVKHIKPVKIIRSNLLQLSFFILSPFQQHIFFFTLNIEQPDRSVGRLDTYSGIVDSRSFFTFPVFQGVKLMTSLISLVIFIFFHHDSSSLAVPVRLAVYFSSDLQMPSKGLYSLLLSLAIYL